MKKVWGNILVVVFGLYFLSLTVAMPYYNWQYAKEHGFIRWLFLGEIVATLKSIAWPYFVSSASQIPGSPDERHYVNSKKACDEAMQIVVKVGDVTRLGSDEKRKVAGLLGLAIAEANQVQSTYLQKVHPEFPRMYKNYKYAMNLLTQGFRTDDAALVLTGAYGYNEYVQWVEAHKKKLFF